MVEMNFIVHFWFEFFQKYAERQTWNFLSNWQISWLWVIFFDD